MVSGRDRAGEGTDSGQKGIRPPGGDFFILSAVGSPGGQWLHISRDLKHTIRGIIFRRAQNQGSKLAT